MEAKPIFKPKMQIVSFHKIDDVDDFQFDNECPDNDNSNIAFTVWADGLFNPKDFDGVNLVKVSEIVKQIKWLKDRALHTCIAKPVINLDHFNELIDEAFSDLLTFPKEKETNSG